MSFKSQIYYFMETILYVLAIITLILEFIFITINECTINYNNSFSYIECAYLRAKDGDTLVVKIDNIEETLRLVEIDTPESVNPDYELNTTEGIIASNFVKSLLKEGQILYISKDMTDRDKYGRLLRLVWLEKPKNDSEEELRNKCLNAILILKGYARVVKYDDYKNQKVFRKFEKEYNEYAQTYYE